MQGLGRLATEKQRQSREKNLAPHRFKPGQSGNPAGRPKRKTLIELIEDELAKEIGRGAAKRLGKEDLARLCVRWMRQGNERILTEYLKRDSPVTQRVEIEGTVSVEDVGEKRESLERKGLRVVDDVA